MPPAYGGSVKPSQGRRTPGTTFLLIPSPLLGPSTWALVQAHLVSRGHDALTVPVRDVTAVAAGLETVVIVAHSNAGYWTPHLADQMGDVPTVYVDAALPAADVEETALAPPAFLEFLAGLADAEGHLPPWTQWWENASDLFPDESTRLAVEAEQPRLSLDWFRQRVPVPLGWATKPCAYIAFGSTYAREAEFAHEQGWPVRVLDGGHLNQLHNPEVVARAIVDAASALGV